MVLCKGDERTADKGDKPAQTPRVAAVTAHDRTDGFPENCAGGARGVSAAEGLLHRTQWHAEHPMQLLGLEGVGADVVLAEVLDLDPRGPGQFMSTLADRIPQRRGKARVVENSDLPARQKDCDPA